MKRYSVAIVGATGAVGTQMLRCLEEQEFPVGSLKLLASPRSAGRIMIDSISPYQSQEQEAIHGRAINDGHPYHRDTGQ